MGYVYYRGKRLNQRTIDMIERVEKRLGYKLEIMQGSYNAGGVSASAGTHDGGGVIDVRAGSDYKNKVLQMRKTGFAAWYRPYRPGVWPAHIHAVAIGDKELSSGARAQVAEYYNGGDGLAGTARDNGPRLNPIPVWYVNLPNQSLKWTQFCMRLKNPRRPRRAVKRIQALLNYRRNERLLVDGIAGPKTKAAYTRWERHIGVKSPNHIPGKYSLRKLFAGFYDVVL